MVINFDFWHLSITDEDLIISEVQNPSVTY